MSKNILLQKKIRLFFFSLLIVTVLAYTSQNLSLNDRSQRFLVKFLNVPQQFMDEALSQYREFENEKLVQLEEEILNLQNQIYERDLQIRSLENLRPFTDIISFKMKNLDLYQLFDQMNFTCCNKHRIYINNLNNLSNKIYAVSQGNFVVGKTKNISTNEMEVRLLSDPGKYISIKTPMVSIASLKNGKK